MDDAEAKADDALLERLFSAADKKASLDLSAPEVERLADIIAMLELELTTLQVANYTLARALGAEEGVLH